MSSVANREYQTNRNLRCILISYFLTKAGGRHAIKPYFPNSFSLLCTFFKSLNGIYSSKAGGKRR